MLQQTFLGGSDHSLVLFSETNVVTEIDATGTRIIVAFLVGSRSEIECESSQVSNVSGVEGVLTECEVETGR